MDFPAVLATLDDLPSTFKRSTGWYPQLMDSIASSLALYTNEAQATLDQVQDFAFATSGWLDVWGLLFGIPRLAGEADAAYQPRIQNTVLAWVATVPAIQFWVNLYIPGSFVLENLPGYGYTISFPGNVTLAQIQVFLNSFNRIRPVGVSFSLQQAGLGLYFGTEEFLGDGMVVGNYLTALSTPIKLSLGASTPNSTPLLPALLLTDPSINS